MALRPNLSLELLVTVRPFLKWAGGKGQLLTELTGRMPAHFGRYHEPFLGGGAFFFSLWSGARLAGGALLSDYNPELIDAYTAVRDHVDDLIEALSDASIEIARDDGPDSLAILDAVRGRSHPRPICVLHGLEHGRWPAQPVAGVLLSPEDRTQLGGDWFDERGRAAGELASLLACAARGLSRLVLGIPCGERQPSGWLATICEQAEESGDPTWRLDALRSAPDAEAVAGAPLGPDDSQGAYEHALWHQPVHQPSLHFTVPPCAPADLGLRVSSLDLALGDSFALVCQRLALGGVLHDSDLMDDGNLLHALLAQLAAFPVAQWPVAFERLLDGWVNSTPDALTRAARRQRTPRLREVIGSECKAAADATVTVEQRLTVCLDLGDLGAMELKGRADRLDRHADGSVTVIDYKRGRSTSLSKKVAEHREAQVLAYVQSLRASGVAVREGVFVPLASGKRVAIDGDEALVRWAEVCRSVADLARGQSRALLDGACPPAVIRALEFADDGDVDQGDVL